MTQLLNTAAHHEDVHNPKTVFFEPIVSFVLLNLIIFYFYLFSQRSRIVLISFITTSFSVLRLRYSFDTNYNVSLLFTNKTVLSSKTRQRHRETVLLESLNLHNSWNVFTYVIAVCFSRGWSWTSIGYLFIMDVQWIFDMDIHRIFGCQWFGPP